MNYANLWGISAYQFTDSCLTMDDYALKAKALGYKAIGIADKSSVYAWPDFFLACQSNGLKPIVGVNFRIDHAHGTKNCLLYVQNEEGYNHLCELLALKAEGLTLSDLKGKTSGLILVIPMEEFVSAEADQRIFADLARSFTNVYLGTEIRTKEDEIKAGYFRDFANTHSYPLVALPKVRYEKKKGEFLLKVLNSEKTKTPLSAEEIKDQDLGGPDFLLSPKAIDKLYSKEERENAWNLASSCNFSLFSTKRGHLLSYCGSDSEDRKKLEEKAIESLKGKSLLNNKTYFERAEMELNVIAEMGFSSYFLIVSDYVNQARAMGIKVGPGRGSACGCLIAYLLGITQIDPLKYDLSFERFLNPKRVTMPDIDIDFEDTRRNEIVEYLKQKYGEKRVSQIVTFHTYKARSAINCAAFALGMPENRIAAILKMIPKTGSVSLRKTIEENPRLANLAEDPYYSKTIELALHIEGLPVEPSIHAAGVILNDTDIYRQCQLSQGQTGVAAYEYPILESLGFLKVDLLSLHFLTFIKRIEEKAKASGQTVPNYEDVREDKATYKTICDGNLLLVFQLDGQGIKKAVKTIEPNKFDDLVALLALYRPGPMGNIPVYAERKKSGVIPSTGYKELDTILKDTNGIIIYQEQILRIAHEIGGLDMGEADLLRRAISKKDQKKMESYRQDFINGAIKNGVSKKDAEGIYALILKFADYGFNKSHTVAYALLTFETAYLKTHYPAQFYLTALEEFAPSSPDFKRLESEAKKYGLKIGKASVENSDINDSLQGQTIVLGLKRVKGVPDDLLKYIVSERGEGYKSLGNFLLKVGSKYPLNARSLQSLADAGALDDFGYPRYSIINRLNDLADFSAYAVDESQLPMISNEEPPLLEKEKEFLRELDTIGACLSFDLRKLYGNVPKGYSVGIVCDNPQLGNNMVELANRYCRMKFNFPNDVHVKMYDLVCFQAKENRFGRYMNATDVHVIHPDEK